MNKKKAKYYKMERREFEHTIEFGDHLCYTTEDEHNVYAIDTEELAIFCGGVVTRDTIDGWESRAKTALELIELMRNLELTNNPLVKGMRRMSKCGVCGSEFPYNRKKKYCSDYCKKKAERMRERERKLAKRVEMDCK